MHLTEEMKQTVESAVGVSLYIGTAASNDIKGVETVILHFIIQ